MSAPSKHLALTIEVPCMYTDDIMSGGVLDEYRAEFESESEFILNSIGEPGVVRLRMEISGEKDGEVVEVWGLVREAALIEPSRGYDLKEPHLTDEQLAENGDNLMRDERACEWCAVPGSMGEEDEDDV